MMTRKNISRKQALKQLGRLTIGSQLLFPLISYANDHPGTSGSGRKLPPLKKNKRPHIILIMTDQHRADALGCAGNKAIKTPNLDALANQGGLFSQAYTPAPSCTPARSCLLTGMEPWHNGMLGYGKIARKYKYELPRMLGEGGYYTYAIGKNHWFPPKALHGFNGTLVDESGRVEQEGFVSDYHDWFKRQAPDEDPDKTGIGWNSRYAKAYELDTRLHPTSWVGSMALEFLNNYNANAPLFLKISFARPHSPYDPPQEYLDRYDGIDVPTPSLGDWEGKIYNYPDENKSIPTTGDPGAAFGNFGEEAALKARKHYYANISFIDDQIGKIVAGLKERDMYDNALIVFLSDHGDELGDHYHWRKAFPYQGSVHIPFIMKWPKDYQSVIRRGSKIEQVVGLQDVLPTFLAASGQKIPTDMDGKNILDLIKQGTAQWRKYIGMEHATCYFENNYWAAVTDGKRKYIWNFHTGQEQFFDLEIDARENNDLINDKKRTKEIDLWRNHLVDYLKERGPEFVKDGKPVKRKQTMTYSPNYPRSDKDGQKWLQQWRKEEKSSFKLRGNL